MAEVLGTPMPAKGDIFTFGGKLTITNAAANVFVVYDRHPVNSKCCPSSLSVEFVMGNVYLIDASFFAPTKWGGTQLFGNLIRGLGLQAEGRRQGDTYVDTVYDDVVCVVANQTGNGCFVEMVAGNLYTVSNLGRDQEEFPVPLNVNIAHVNGLSLKESHLAQGGGLSRAYAAWSSMTFRSARRRGSTKMARAEKQTNAGNSQVERLPASQHGTEYAHLSAKAQLQDAISEREGIREDEKRSMISPNEATKHNTVAGQAPKVFVAEEQNGHSQFDGFNSIICGNCGRVGHQVMDCIGPVDDHGFIAACPLCNKKDHGFDKCFQARYSQKGVRRKQALHWLVNLRANKAPIKSSLCWISVWARSGAPTTPLPHTKQFALNLARRTTTVTYPDWKSYQYRGGNDSVQGDLYQDPDTIVKAGKPCALVPGSQSSSSSDSANHSRVKEMLKRYHPGIQLVNESSKKTSSKKKQKKKQRHSMRLQENTSKGGAKMGVLSTDGPATGANRTILQKPLPGAVTSRSFASIKMEPDALD